jgi:hypothetical protein
MTIRNLFHSQYLGTCSVPILRPQAAIYRSKLMLWNSPYFPFRPMQAIHASALLYPSSYLFSPTGSLMPAMSRSHLAFQVLVSIRTSTTCPIFCPFTSTFCMPLHSMLNEPVSPNQYNTPNKGIPACENADSRNSLSPTIRNLKSWLQHASRIHKSPLIFPALARFVINDLPGFVEGLEPINYSSVLRHRGCVS